jgi:hypothetical protein
MTVSEDKAPGGITIDARPSDEVTVPPAGPICAELAALARLKGCGSLPGQPAVKTTRPARTRRGTRLRLFL